MTARSRTYLKGISETGDIADQELFEDLIDSAANVTDDAISNEAVSLNVRADKKRFPTTKVTQSGALTFTSVSSGAINGYGEVKVVTCDGSDITLTGDFTNYSTINTTAGQTIVITFVWNSSLAEYMVSVDPSGAVTDTTPPTATSATVENADPDALVVVFSEAVTLTDMTGLSLNGDWTGVTISSLTSGDGTNTLTFALDTPIANGESGSFVYGATNNIEDTSGNGLVTSSTAVTNNVDSSYTFANTHELVVDASGEGVLVTDSNLWPTGDYSVEFWIEPLIDASNHNYLILTDSGGTFSTIISYATSQTKIRARTFTDLSNYINLYGNTTPTNGALLHIVLTYNNSTQTMTLYRNGSDDSNTQNEIGTFTGVPAASGTITFDIGGSGGAAPGDCNYQVVRMFNEELTSGEVTTLYNSGTPVGLNISLQGKCIGEWLLNNNANADNVGTNGVNQGTVTYQTI